jgi:uncharacterized membrane protein
VRLHFQARPVDLYLALGYSIVVSAFVVARDFGNLFGLGLVAVVPGYLAMAALIPRADSADWAFRLALTAGLSLSLIAFIGIVVNFTPWGITLVSMTVSLLALCIVLAILAYVRRMALPEDQRLEATIPLAWMRWRDYRPTEKVLAVVLAVSLAVILPVLGISFMTPRPTPAFTELYLVGPTGNLTGYPLQMNVSTPATVTVVVANHEGTPTQYSLGVHLLGLISRFNATSGQNETVVANDSTLNTYNSTFADGATWELPYTFSIPSAGGWELEFLLFRGSVSGTPYRQAHLLIVVHP